MASNSGFSALSAIDRLNSKIEQVSPTAAGNTSSSSSSSSSSTPRIAMGNTTSDNITASLPMYKRFDAPDERLLLRARAKAAPPRRTSAIESDSTFGDNINNNHHNMMGSPTMHVTNPKVDSHNHHPRTSARSSATPTSIGASSPTKSSISPTPTTTTTSTNNTTTGTAIGGWVDYEATRYDRELRRLASLLADMEPSSIAADPAAFNTWRAETLKLLLNYSGHNKRLTNTNDLLRRTLDSERRSHADALDIASNATRTADVDAAKASQDATKLGMQVANMKREIIALKETTARLEAAGREASARYAIAEQGRVAAISALHEMQQQQHQGAAQNSSNTSRQAVTTTKTTTRVVPDGILPLFDGGATGGEEASSSSLLYQQQQQNYFSSVASASPRAISPSARSVLTTSAYSIGPSGAFGGTLHGTSIGGGSSSSSRRGGGIGGGEGGGGAAGGQRVPRWMAPTFAQLMREKEQAGRGVELEALPRFEGRLSQREHLSLRSRSPSALDRIRSRSRSRSPTGGGDSDANSASYLGGGTYFSNASASSISPSVTSTGKGFYRISTNSLGSSSGSAAVPPPNSFTLTYSAPNRVGQQQLSATGVIAEDEDATPTRAKTLEELSSEPLSLPDTGDSAILAAAIANSDKLKAMILENNNENNQASGSSNNDAKKSSGGALLEPENEESYSSSGVAGKSSSITEAKVATITTTVAAEVVAVDDEGQKKEKKDKKEKKEKKDKKEKAENVDDSTSVSSSSSSAAPTEASSAVEAVSVSAIAAAAAAAAVVVVEDASSKTTTASAVVADASDEKPSKKDKKKIKDLFHHLAEEVTEIGTEKKAKKEKKEKKDKIECEPLEAAEAEALAAHTKSSSTLTHPIPEGGGGGSAETAPAAPEVTTAAIIQPVVEEGPDKYDAMKGDELRIDCENRKLSTEGKREDMRARLRADDASKKTVAVAEKSAAVPVIAGTTTTTTTTTTTNEIVDKYEGMKGEELRAECEKRSLRVEGKRDDLRARLRQADVMALAAAALMGSPGKKAKKEKKEKEASVASESAPAPAPAIAAPALANYDNMKGEELRAECEARKLNPEGKRDELRSRLRDHDAAQATLAAGAAISSLANSSVVAAVSNAIPPLASAASPAVVVVASSYDDLKGDELRAACESRGLSTEGKRDELRTRLRDDDAAKATMAAGAAISAIGATAAAEATSVEPEKKSKKEKKDKKEKSEEATISSSEAPVDNVALRNKWKDMVSSTPKAMSAYESSASSSSSGNVTPGSVATPALLFVRSGRTGNENNGSSNNGDDAGNQANSLSMSPMAESYDASVDAQKAAAAAAIASALENTDFGNENTTSDPPSAIAPLLSSPLSGTMSASSAAGRWHRHVVIKPLNGSAVKQGSSSSSSSSSSGLIEPTSIGTHPAVFSPSPSSASSSASAAMAGVMSSSKTRLAAIQQQNNNSSVAPPSLRSLFNQSSASSSSNNNTAASSASSVPSTFSGLPSTPSTSSAGLPPPPPPPHDYRGESLQDLLNLITNTSASTSTSSSSPSSLTSSSLTHSLTTYNTVAAGGPSRPSGNNETTAAELVRLSSMAQAAQSALGMNGVARGGTPITSTSAATTSSNQ